VKQEWVKVANYIRIKFFFKSKPDLTAFNQTLLVEILAGYTTRHLARIFTQHSLTNEDFLIISTQLLVRPVQNILGSCVNIKNTTYLI
jgi:hypothetical protein